MKLKFLLTLISLIYSTSASLYSSTINLEEMQSSNPSVRKTFSEYYSKKENMSPTLLEEFLELARRNVLLSDESIKANRVAATAIEILGNYKYQPAFEFLVNNIHFSKRLGASSGMVSPLETRVCVIALTKFGDSGIQKVFDAYDASDTNEAMWSLLAAINHCANFEDAKTIVESKYKDEILAPRYQRLLDKMAIFIRR